MSKIHNWALNKVAKYQAKEEGQGLAEYALILALVAIAAVGALGFLAGGIGTTLDSVTGNL